MFPLQWSVHVLEGRRLSVKGKNIYDQRGNVHNMALSPFPCLETVSRGENAIESTVSKIDMRRRYRYNLSKPNLDNGISGDSASPPDANTAPRKARENKVKRPKNANGTGNIRQKPNGKFEGRVMINKQSFSFTGNSREEVQARINKALFPLNFDETIKPEDMTVSQFIEQWRGTYTQDIKKSTMQRYDLDIRLRIVPLIGEIKLCELRPVVITQLYNFVQNQGLSNKSIKNLHGTLHRILEDAVENDYLSRNVADRAKIPKATEPKKEMRPLKDSEVPLFLTAIKGHKFANAYLIALYTGMRESELIGLTWDCIDWEKKRIRLYRQLPRDQEKGVADTFTTLKNGQSRIIAPADEVFSILRKARAEQAEKKLRAGEEWSNKESFVFTDDSGEHLKRVTLYNNFKRIVASIGLPEVRFHDLRHTYATISLQIGIDVKTVSANLGHADVAFTMNKYGHVTEGMHEKSQKTWQEYIEKVQ